ncbi:MAG: CRISPR-associated RAMP protein [Blastochloris sp.]|nr:CRISPR-associated RAMP protein [Blastochloris sp.]
MLKQLVNEARFAIMITTTGPLLIKSGHPTLIGPDMTPVLTLRNGEPQVYIPGPSLKGMFRSHTEKVIRTIRNGETVVADPFKDRGEDQSCGSWFRQQDDMDTATVYKQSDPIARLFGSTSFIGRVSIGDAYLADPETRDYLKNVTQNQRMPTEVRDGVGIDRLTGGASPGALFQLEAVSTGTCFRTEVLLRNFECWQLGAILLVVQDMEDDLIRLGSGKSRGLGAVHGHVDEVMIHHLGRTPERSATDIWGLGHFLGNKSPYGTQANDQLSLTTRPSTTTRGIRTVQTFTNESLHDLKQAAIQEFVRRMETYPTLEACRGGTHG